MSKGTWTLNKVTFFNHPSICALPWNGIFINPDGKVTNCAISGEVLGNINTESLRDIVNNTINKTVRQDMLDGIKHDRCLSCYSVEDNSGLKTNQSNRSWYKQIAIKNADMTIFDSVERFEPNVLDLRWRNTCNNACAYCAPDLSSYWASLMDDDRWTINEDNLTESKNYIFDQLKSVKHVYLAGGEPLLMKDNYELLSRLYECNPTVDIRINSNISNLNSPVYSQITKFKNVRWTISVDSMGQHFEYIRWPSKWNTFIENAHTIKNHANDNINFNMVWCIMNPTEILDTIDFLIEQGFHENMFVIQCLIDPSPLSILHLPQDYLEGLKVKIKKRMEHANPQWWLYKSLTSMYNFLSNPSPAFRPSTIMLEGKEGLDGTIEYLKKVDSVRNTDSRSVFKELYKIYDSF